MMEPPKIEFPCDYPIKVIGESRDGLLEVIVEIAQRHDPAVSHERVQMRPSRNGNYHAITISFWATGEGQLKRLFEDLKTCDAVRLVL